MRYHEPQPITKDDAEAVFSEGDVRSICDALVRLAHNERDLVWVELKCLMLATHSSREVRRTVATCLGHLARIHGRLDLKKVQPVLEELARDPDIVGVVEDAWDDIVVYIPSYSKRKLGD